MFYPKIIHITIGQFSTYNAISLRIDQTLESGVQVQIWDIAEMINLPPTSQTIYKNLIISIKNRADLKKRIKKNKHALFVTGINPEKRFFWVYYYLARLHCKHAKIANGWIKEYSSSKWKCLVALRRKIKKFFLESLQAFTIFSLPQYIFLPGYYWNNKLPGKPKIINVNHLLYDQFLELQKEGQKQQCIKLDRGYILFLDEAHPNHPDWKITGGEPIDSSTYFKKMQLFFDKIERLFCLPVIIAAHPKATYIGNEFGFGTFGNRKIFSNLTLELASNASIFLAHISTTRILPIIHNKPIYLIWLDFFSSYSQSCKNQLFGFHQEIGCPILKEKDLQNDFEKFTPNITKYNMFLYKYIITKKYKNTNTLDIIGKKLVELAKQ